MLTLYFAPRTRAIRVRWLLEELELPHQLKRVPFQIPTRTFEQQTPLGKLPVIEDGEVTICESGAIVEYILERYGEGRLAPPIGAPRRGEFLQWVHFAESTAFAPVGVIVWHTLYKNNADAVPLAIAGAHERADDAFAFVDRALQHRPYLLGAAFSAADIMMGFTLIAAQMLGALDSRHANLAPYIARLQERPAFQRSAEL
jgi:glutathione S-transferase